VLGLVAAGKTASCMCGLKHKDEALMFRIPSPEIVLENCKLFLGE